MFEQINDNILDANNGTIIITDKKQIAEVAKEQNINDPESITEITYEFRNFSNNQEGRQIEDRAKANSKSAPTCVRKVYNVKDLGAGYSYWDQFASDYIDGPATFTKHYERTGSSTYSTDVNVSSDLVAAAVGFQFTSGWKITDDYQFNVPAGQRIELKVFINYQKKSYEIGDDCHGLLYYVGSGTAQKPVGLIFRQVKR